MDHIRHRLHRKHFLLTGCLLLLAQGCSAPPCGSDADCKDDRICEDGACVSPASPTTSTAAGEACGDGRVGPDEQCDDGNDDNGDGCNIRCDLEPSQPLPDGTPLSGSDGSAAVPVDLGECGDENMTLPFTPGPSMVVRTCAVRYANFKEQGVSAAHIQDELAKAQEFFDAADARLKLVLLYTDTFPVASTETDPKTDAELSALHIATRQRADASHPGECDLVVGFTNTLQQTPKPNQPTVIGGQATFPWSGLHECLVASYNVGSGQTTAHEAGHIFGLFHTFEGGGDGCQDTPEDPQCGGQGCGVGCAPESIVHNVMSYYHCDTPHADASSPCQIRRARCFATHMFNLADDPCFNANYCNGHGTCADGKCTCNTGFAGAQCDTCASGYSPPDCTLNCPPNYCNGHGSCTNNACTCNEGYAGPTCDSCASGYVGDPCQPNCPFGYCNGHGTCTNNICTCNLGYATAYCDQCDSGYSGYPTCTENATSFESFNKPGYYVRHKSFLGRISQISSLLDQADASFQIVSGLADPNCVSFQSYNYQGYYLRHQSYQIKLHAYSNDALYKNDATFCERQGLADSSDVSYESKNKPGYYIRHKDYYLYIATGFDMLFKSDATFKKIPALYQNP